MTKHVGEWASVIIVDTAPEPSSFTTQQVLSGVNYQLLLFQAGTYYVRPVNFIATLNQWVTASGNATSFVKIGGGPGPTVPNLSGTGPPIQFGYMCSNTLSFDTPFTTSISGIDNWSITINGDVIPVLPSSWGSIKNTYR